VAIAAVIGIFLLLQAAIGSWRLAAGLFVCLPLGLSGCLLALFMSSQVLTLGSFVGFFAAFAMGVRFALTQVKGYQRMEREDGEEFGPALILRGAHDRSLPMITTAIVTGLSLAPFAFSGSIAGQEVVHPMAVVLLGGLITTTLLNLFVVPVLYLRFHSPLGEPDAAEVVTIPEVEQVSGT
jgi:Cu/Ag efflux pump CusA